MSIALDDEVTNWLNTKTGHQQMVQGGPQPAVAGFPLSHFYGPQVPHGWDSDRRHLRANSVQHAQDAPRVGQGEVLG
jgi:hypothetical protein